MEHKREQIEPNGHTLSTGIKPLKSDTEAQLLYFAAMHINKSAYFVAMHIKPVFLSCCFTYKKGELYVHLSKERPI